MYHLEPYFMSLVRSLNMYESANQQSNSQGHKSP